MLRIVNAKQKLEWGSAMPMRENGWLRNAAAKKQFMSKMFRPPADGEMFDLGVMEIER
jgi:hypothetical protein